jgi:hypothetical protein
MSIHAAKLGGELFVASMVARAIIFRGAVISYAMQLRAHYNQGVNRYDDVQIRGDGACDGLLLVCSLRGAGAAVECYLTSFTCLNVPDTCFHDVAALEKLLNVAPAILCFMKFVTNATVAKQYDAGQPAENTVSVSSDDMQLWVCTRSFRTSVALMRARTA